MDVLSKNEFCQIINNLKRNEEFIDKINNIFNEFKLESSIFSTGLENTSVSLLESIFSDKENQYISYWIWECNFGETFEVGNIVEPDGFKPDISTPEKLYDYLIKCKEE